MPTGRKKVGSDGFGEYGKIKAALQASEARFHVIYENAVEGIFQSSPSGRFLSVNPAMARIFGYASPEEMIETIGDDIEHKLYVNPERRAEFTGILDAQGTIRDFENTNYRKDGSIVWTHTNARAVRDSKGDLLYYEGFLTDISARKKTEQALMDSEQRFHSLFDNTTIGLYRTTPDGQILLANPTIVQLLGYDSFDELATRNLEQDGFEPEYQRSQFRELIETNGMVKGLESIWKRKDGQEIYVRESAKAIRDENGKVIYYEGTVEDITERKLAELQVQAALAEKEVLLREIHHRVKNNLAMISSLLELQARASRDARVKNAFQESQQRIRSMTQIHELLYHSESLTTIDMSRYVSGLADELRCLYTKGDVAVQVDIERVNLNIDQAIPCGLIINELVTNALKYAFPPRLEEDKAGSSPETHKPERPQYLSPVLQVIIMMHAVGDHCLLTVSDNGVGMPSGLDIRTTRTLGLRLVSRLADQLGGSLTMNGEGHLAGKGTVFQVLFPLRK